VGKKILELVWVRISIKIVNTMLEKTKESRLSDVLASEIMSETFLNFRFHTASTFLFEAARL